MRHLSKRSVSAAFVVTTAASSLFVGGPALATGGDDNYTDVRTIIRGGDATAVSLCVNLAARGWDIKQVARCRNVDAVAAGGNVELNNVNVTVISRHGSHNYTRVNTVVEGGDATAVAACINAAFHSSETEQRVRCNNVTSAAVGGNVTLNDVDIYVES